MEEEGRDGTYQELLKDYAALVYTTREWFFERLIYLSETSIYKYEMELLEDDDEYPFELSMFQNTENESINLISDLVVFLGNCTNTLINLNGYDVDDLKEW